MEKQHTMARLLQYRDAFQGRAGFSKPDDSELAATLDAAAEHMKLAEGVMQVAPQPFELFELVGKCSYRPGWVCYIEPDLDRGQGSKGLTLAIISRGYDTYHPDRGETYRVAHYFPVPPAAYDRRSWQRWLLEQFLLVERHEACEFFQIDGERPYAPHHGPGNDPYIIFEHGTDEDARTSFRGEVKPEEASA